MYKKVKNQITGELSNVILRLSDSAFIPMDENNFDYKEYLKWIDEGNQPQEAK